MVRKSTVATLCAVAASKFDLTGEPYDLIIRLSAEKPARRRCTYWPGPARHYRVAVMTRASPQALSAPGICPVTQGPDPRQHPRSALIIDPLTKESTCAEVIDLRLQCNQRSRIFAFGLQIRCWLKFATTDHRANSDSRVGSILMWRSVGQERAGSDPTNGPQFAAAGRWAWCY
jgi:hypothetical protein